MTTTPILGATDLVAAQAIPETSVNQNTRRLEQGGQYFSVLSRTTTTPPGSPADGAAYIVAASATGAWAGQDGKIAYYQSGTGWLFIAPRTGFRAYVADAANDYRYASGAWTTASALAGYAVDTDGTLAANSDSNLATQKATKTYVDGKVAGLSWKQEVRAGTTTAGTLSSSFANGSVIDGVTLATGDRILIKNQATGSENGIYTVNASGSPTRATDADAGSELVNATVYISEGTTLADTQWTCTTNAPITLGTTSLAFAQLATGGGALQAANNLSDVASASTARSNLGAAASGAATASGLTLNTGKLLGRTTASTGAIEEIAPDSSLSLASGTLKVAQYIVSMFFTTTPTSSEVLLLHVAGAAFTIPANFAAALQPSIGTSPAATFGLDVQKNGTSIGTITVSTGGSVTASTTGGTSKSVAAGDVIKIVAPSTADTTAANMAFTIIGAR